MLLTTLLEQAYTALKNWVTAEPYGQKGVALPEQVIFFSTGNAAERARIHIARGASLDEAWTSGAQYLADMVARENMPLQWLRVDLVSEVHAMSWAALCELFSRTK